MIKYALRCANEHQFEAWFNSSSAFDELKSADLLKCPVCASSDVEKALMAPSVVTRKGGQGTAPVGEPVPTATDAPSEAPPASADSQDYSPVSLDPRHAKVVDFMRQLRAHVEATTEDVGRQFAEEARKIHYEEVQPRGIRGEASSKEVEELQEEGISVAPLPRLPGEHN